MDNLSLFNKINSLPDSLKQQVQDFVDFLQARNQKAQPKKPREFGSLKGKIHMADDFDAPLDDFKEYM